jgi:hypothetical protein
MVTKRTSASRSQGSSFRALLWDVLRCAFQQLFGSTRKKPIGYWARDRYGRWELRVPAHGYAEQPPTGWGQRTR